MKVRRNSWHFTLYCFFRQCVCPLIEVVDEN